MPARDSGDPGFHDWLDECDDRIGGCESTSAGLVPGAGSTHVMVPSPEHQLLVDMSRFIVVQQVIAAAVHLHEHSLTRIIGAIRQRSVQGEIAEEQHVAAPCIDRCRIAPIIRVRLCSCRCTAAAITCWTTM